MQSRRVFSLLARAAVSSACVAALWACKSQPASAPTEGGEPATPAPAVAEPTTPVAAEAAEPAAQHPVAKPFLWEVTRGEATSYLFGTIHTRYQLRDLPASVRERLDAAATLVVETDVSSLSPTAVIQLAMLPPEQSLRTMLGDEDWNKLVGEVGEFMPAVALERLQPWFAALLVSLGEAAMASPDQVMDMQILARARAADKRVVFLEDAQEQLEILGQTGDLESLKEMLADLDKVHRLLDEVLDAYGRGDLDTLAEASLDPEEMKKRPEVFEKLFFARNRAWVESLDPLLAKGGVFVAVGAGHYVGDRGLVALLSAAGYELRRVE
ncbi:TraB/GumN family protein [Haliangium sp.]|uniref:TraB/GumN family protein n=1 Tax=Haliangium sp. TaxID=2663208 RepID=UPI003D098EFE